MYIYNKGPLCIDTYKTTRLSPHYVRSTSKLPGFGFSFSIFGLGLIVIYWGRV